MFVLLKESFLLPIFDQLSRKVDFLLKIFLSFPQVCTKIYPGLYIPVFIPDAVYGG